MCMVLQWCTWASATNVATFVANCFSKICPTWRTRHQWRHGNNEDDARWRHRRQTGDERAERRQHDVHVQWWRLSRSSAHRPVRGRSTSALMTSSMSVLWRHRVAVIVSWGHRQACTCLVCIQSGKKNKSYNKMECLKVVQLHMYICIL